MFRSNIPFDLPKLPPSLNLQQHPDFMGIIELHNNALKKI